MSNERLEFEYRRLNVLSSRVRRQPTAIGTSRRQGVTGFDIQPIGLLKVVVGIIKNG